MQTNRVSDPVIVRPPPVYLPNQPYVVSGYLMNIIVSICVGFLFLAVRQIVLLKTKCHGWDSTFTSLGFHLGRKRPNYRSLAEIGNIRPISDVLSSFVRPTHPYRCQLLK